MTTPAPTELSLEPFLPSAAGVEDSVTMTPTIPQPEKSGFLALPAEIRLNIYRMVYHQIGVSVNGWLHGCEQWTEYPEVSWFQGVAGCHQDRCGDGHRGRSEIGLLLVSKFIYNEVKPVFDNAPVSYAYEDKSLYSMDELPVHVRRRVRTVITTCSTAFLYLAVDVGCVVDLDLPNARNIWVVFPKDVTHPLPPSIEEYILERLQNEIGPLSLEDGATGDAGDLLPGSWNRGQLHKQIHQYSFSVRIPYRFCVEVGDSTGPSQQKIVHKAEYNAVLLFDASGGRIEGMPDLRCEWWWKEWRAQAGSYSLPNEDTTAATGVGRFEVTVKCLH
ncbi:hypothetical protein H2200_003084 [Cladophialophora chaetospira]|uniref:Uncharacterized protein n=1 Tax=Cladophialophora chaetospira TaxID=386627 RepID=A0AA39CME5_9EURO|nr:hypothetical protein H2200_003084 [Cladophialophora chaetospira]